MNKDTIIIYGSCYGTTKTYAEELSRRLDCEAVSYEDAGDINIYQTIIYMGGLYAGGVRGMRKTMKRLHDISSQRILIATVGLADPENEENIAAIRKNIKAQVSEEIFNKAMIFHLRGGIDYSGLSFIHKKMMGLVYKKVIRIPEEERDAEAQGIIETYNKQVDFVDLDSLNQIESSL